MENKLVFLENNQAVTTSLKVAEYFGKEHFNVIRDIRGLIDQINQFNFEGVKIFYATTYTDTKGEERPMYEMNRDGFSLLAMGFTGAKALKFKLDFIAEFNRMENFILNAGKLFPPVSDFERGKELVKMVPFAKDFFTQNKLIAKAANLILSENFLSVPVAEKQISLFYA